jgi:hypothetical protein
MGMTLAEVETALDVAQTHYDRGAMDPKIGEGNVGLCHQTAQRLPAAGERWIHFQNAFGNHEQMGQQISVRMKDGLVAEKRFHQGTSP